MGVEDFLIMRTYITMVVERQSPGFVTLSSKLPGVRRKALADTVVAILELASDCTWNSFFSNFYLLV